ncbi:hypothetical protein D3C86_1567770 [compost metagenome]
MAQTRLVDAQNQVLYLAHHVELIERSAAVEQQLLVAFGEDLDATTEFQISNPDRIALHDYHVASASSALLAGELADRQNLLRVDRGAVRIAARQVQNLLDLASHVRPDRVRAGGVELGPAVFDFDPQTMEMRCVHVLL